VEWVCEALSHFVPSAEYGISTSLVESGNPVLRMNNLLDGDAELSDLKYTERPVPDNADSCSAAERNLDCTSIWSCSALCADEHTQTGRHPWAGAGNRGRR